MNQPASEPRSPSTLHSAFVLLRALGRMQQHPVGVSRLAAATGVPKTTVHRLLEQLARENIVQRQDGRWTFAPGVYCLDRRCSDLASVAHHRLRSLSMATGASVFLYDGTGKKLTAMSCAYGARWNGIMSRSEQRRAAENPASAARAALDTGRMTLKYRTAHPECSCIATPFYLPSGELAIITLGLPNRPSLEPFKRPLDMIARLIESDMRGLHR